MSGMQDLINKIAQPLNVYVENNEKLLIKSDSVGANTIPASTNTVVKDTSASSASSSTANSATASNSAKGTGAVTKSSSSVKTVAAKASVSSTSSSTKGPTITPSPKASASSTNLAKEDVVNTSSQSSTNSTAVDSSQEQTTIDNGYFMFFSSAASSVVSTASSLVSGTTGLVSAAVNKATETTENLKNAAESTVYDIELKKAKVNAANDLLNDLNKFCNKVNVHQVGDIKFINQESLLEVLKHMVIAVEATINQVDLVREEHGKRPEGECDKYLRNLKNTLAWFSEPEGQDKTKDNRHVALAISLNYKFNDPRLQKSFSNCTNQQLINIVTEKENNKTIEILQQECSCDYVNAMFNLITDLVYDASKGGLEIHKKYKKEVDELLKKLSSDIILFNNDESSNLDTRDRVQRLKNSLAAFGVDINRFVSAVGQNVFCKNAAESLNNISNNVDNLNRQITSEETRSKQNELRSKMA